MRVTSCTGLCHAASFIRKDSVELCWCLVQPAQPQARHALLHTAASSIHHAHTSRQLSLLHLVNGDLSGSSLGSQRLHRLLVPSELLSGTHAAAECPHMLSGKGRALGTCSTAKEDDEAAHATSTPLPRANSGHDSLESSGRTAYTAYWQSSGQSTLQCWPSQLKSTFARPV
jgi:hypothetical protein